MTILPIHQKLTDQEEIMASTMGVRPRLGDGRKGKNKRGQIEQAQNMTRKVMQDKLSNYHVSSGIVGVASRILRNITPNKRLQP